MRRECRERFFPPPQVSDPAIHHGTCITHVPWCMPGSLTGGFLWSWRRGKRSRYSRRMRNPQSDVSSKRPMALHPKKRWHRHEELIILQNKYQHIEPSKIVVFRSTYTEICSYWQNTIIGSDSLSVSNRRHAINLLTHICVTRPRSDQRKSQHKYSHWLTRIHRVPPNAAVFFSRLGEISF